MKQISLDGRIGKDAEVLSTKGGKKYVRFSVANNSFTNGSEKTEWFDVTSYDPYIVENRVKYLTKGKYVIIHGGINTEVSVKNGKVWLNQYITANSIDTPSFGAKKEDSSEAETEFSTYTATTTDTIGLKKVELEEEPKSEVKPSFVSSSLSSVSDEDEELPF